MKKIELEVCKISEKHPTDGASCWVKPANSYPQQLVYNKEYQCWDDSEGDDYYCDLNNGDIWIELPSNLTDNV